MKVYDLIIIGGGTAGLSSALEAKKNGIEDILILEKETYLGGALNQCIHSGYGLRYYGEELTGVEFAQRFADEIVSENIEYKTDTMVLEVKDGDIKEVTYVNGEGIGSAKGKAIIFSTGCKEKPRGNAHISANKAAGVFTAAMSQRLVNSEGYLPGKEIVIFGSGDIALVVARRMIIEGAKIKAIIEPLNQCRATQKSIKECIDYFGIPLKLRHTIVDILEEERVKGVVVAEVDENLKPIKETEKILDCDTLLLSVGLSPENELIRNLGIEISEITRGPIIDEGMECSKRGFFACGSVVHPYDYVDKVVDESIIAARSVVAFIKNPIKEYEYAEVEAGEGILYAIPNKVNLKALGKKDLKLRIRLRNPMERCTIKIYIDGELVLEDMRENLYTSELYSIYLYKEILYNHKEFKKITIGVESFDYSYMNYRR